MQRLWVLSILSITQDAENAIEKLQNAKKRFCAKAAAILHRVTDKSCVKVSYNTTSGFHDVNESKWCNAYADDAIPCTVWIFLILLLQNQLFCRF